MRKNSLFSGIEIVAVMLSPLLKAAFFSVIYLELVLKRQKCSLMGIIAFTSMGFIYLAVKLFGLYSIIIPSHLNDSCIDGGHSRKVMELLTSLNDIKANERGGNLIKYEPSLFYVLHISATFSKYFFEPKL